MKCLLINFPLALAPAFVAYLSLETFGAGCNSRPAVKYMCVVHVLSPRVCISLQNVVADRIRCDSEADSIVWMGEGLNGDRCVLLPMRNRAIGVYLVFTDDFFVPPLHASRTLVELMVFSALLRK